MCDPAVVSRVVQDRASHFFKFRAEFESRRQDVQARQRAAARVFGGRLPFGHSMVRAIYDYNKNFGRPGGLQQGDLDLLFGFTGGGGNIDGDKRLPKNWVIDWSRFVGVSPHDSADGLPARVARKIDTALAPPLGDMVKEGNDEADAQLKALFKHLARRNLRRGYNLRLPTGQALHTQLKQNSAVQSAPSPTSRRCSIPSRSCATSSRTRNRNSSRRRRSGSTSWPRQRAVAATAWAKWEASSSRQPSSAFCWRTRIPRCLAALCPARVRCG